MKASMHNNPFEIRRTAPHQKDFQLKPDLFYNPQESNDYLHL